MSHSTIWRRDRPQVRRSATRTLLLCAAVIAALFAGACVPPDPGSSGTTTTTTVVDVPDLDVGDVQLSWSYSQYAQYGALGQWSQLARGENVAVNVVDGETATGLPAEAGKLYYQGQFDEGAGAIDPVTGEGSIAWDTGDWVLNAYNGQFGAPDETLRDPILDIEADGSGTLSFEAFIPAGLDMEGNPAPAAGPARIAIATFSSVELTSGGLTVVPDFAGRPYADGSAGPWAACEVEGVPTGGSWPSEWINFVPGSVRAHYYSTGCGGLQLRKPPMPFHVTWTPSPAAITTQPTLSNTAFNAFEQLSTAGAKVGVTGTPTPSVQWQRSVDGENWTDIDGATDTRLNTPLTHVDNNARFRALVGPAEIASDVIGPITVVAVPASITQHPASRTVGVGTAAAFTAFFRGAPTPTIQWEVSRDSGATWTPVTAVLNNVIPGNGVQTGYSLPAATLGDTGLQVRVRGGNGLNGELISNVATLTVVAQLPTFATHPQSNVAFVGQPVQFSETLTGLPTPTIRWEISSDGGVTWADSTVGQATGAATQSVLTIPAAQVTTALDGAQFRARATNAIGIVHSNPASLRVHAVTGGKQVAMSPASPIDPTQPVRISVVGAGFTPPVQVTSALRIAVTDTTQWQPGQPGLTSGWLGTATFLSTALQSGGGYFRREITIPAGSFNNELDYGIATFGYESTESWYDTWTPLAVASSGG